MNCQDVCIPVAEIVANTGNGACEFEFYCEAMQYDQGDCGPVPGTCGPGEFVDCYGDCVSENTLLALNNNGVCDAAFACDEWAGDGSDCAGSMCTDPADLSYFQSHSVADLIAVQETCGEVVCTSGSLMEQAECVAACTSENAGISAECSQCALALPQCLNTQCGLQCSFSATLCELCVESKCIPDLLDCIVYSVE